MQPTRKDLPSLTSLRFFAALSVVLFHYRKPLVPWVPEPLLAPIAHGFVAVSFFFVLSGFILGYNYPAVDQPRRFWRARFARIYPLYLVSLLPGLAIMANPLRADFAEAPVRTALEAASQFFGLHAWYPFAGTSLNFPSWSLSAEFFFYLLFPFLVGPVAGGDRRRAGLAMAASVAAGLAVAAFGAWWIGPVPSHGIDASYDFLKYGAYGRLPEFIAGIALSRWLRERMSDGDRPGFPALTAAGAASVLAAAFFGAAVPPLVLHNAGLVVPTMLLIAGLATERSALRRVLERPTLVFGGSISYAIYILHFPVKAVVDKVAERWIADPAASMTVLAVYLVILLAASATAYRWIEVPAQRRLRGPR